ncbi:unnamed protein product [Schistocephalus solidus]|uniref:Cytochrome c oxidase assembly factor 6 homolog n=1 Tax=Schistocephalus solidus TaxID=70667 RepID=A0A183TBD3_SCHSO|nr:unnamed protein product [Schistocephalus solidus]
MAPTREERQKCWDARDAFWKCIKTELSATVKTARCLNDRKAYEAVCPESWVSTSSFYRFHLCTLSEHNKQRDLGSYSTSL